MRRLLTIIILFCIVTRLSCQPTAGTSGLLNAPSGDIPSDGTFVAGVNYLPENITFQPKFDYNTFNYYVAMTFLPFMEMGFRMILFRDPDNELLHNQDRSLALRVRVLKENKFVPSVVLGGNDIYSTTVSGGSQYFKSVYIAGTKNLSAGGNIIALTAGYAPSRFSKSRFSGFFGGISFSPSFIRSLNVVADYDTEYFNTGASLLLFRHFFLYCFISDFDKVAGGIAFRLFPKGTKTQG